METTNYTKDEVCGKTFDEVAMLVVESVDFSPLRHRVTEIEKMNGRGGLSFLCAAVSLWFTGWRG